MLVALVVLGLVVWLPSLNGEFRYPKIWPAVTMVAFIVTIYGSAFIMMLLGNRMKKLLDLFCPHCRKPLMGIPAQIVVASRHCGHCGARVLEDAD